MNLNDIDKKFVSDYDKFLREFDKTHQPSKSQQKEITKHQRIATLRDNPDAKHKNSKIWSDF